MKLIIFTSTVNRIINTSGNERVTQQVYDTYLQMFDICTPRHTAHIEAIVQFLPYSAQQVMCDGLQSRCNSVLQISYAHGLWWHKHFVLHVTPCYNSARPMRQVCACAANGNDQRYSYVLFTAARGPVTLHTFSHLCPSHSG